MLSPRAAHRKDLSGKPASMTHQHFRKIAETIRSMPDSYGAAAASDFCNALAATNPNFDRRRFMAACGWPE